MKAVVRERRIPFDIRIDSDEEIRAKAVSAFAQMIVNEEKFVLLKIL